MLALRHQTMDAQIIDDVTGNHEHIIPWPGVGANGENFVRV
jgi:hypothetical protein